MTHALHKFKCWQEGTRETSSKDTANNIQQYLALEIGAASESPSVARPGQWLTSPLKPECLSSLACIEVNKNKALVLRLLASMLKGYLAPAAFADEYAQKRLARSSANCWRVCPKAISLQHQLLASMPKGYLAPAPIAGEYAERLSHSSRIC